MVLVGAFFGGLMRTLILVVMAACGERVRLFLLFAALPFDHHLLFSTLVGFVNPLGLDLLAIALQHIFYLAAIELLRIQLAAVE